MRSPSFSYLQAIVALSLIALGSFLLMTGTAFIAVIVSTAVLMGLFVHFLFGRKSRHSDGKRTVQTKHQTSAKGEHAEWNKS